MSLEYIAYDGRKYTVEWFFGRNQRSQALEYFDRLSAKEQQKLFYLIRRIADFGHISDKTKFRNEGDRIYAFKPKPSRFLSFFYHGGKVIITNAFMKKTDKLPKNEKQRAINYRNDYGTRVLQGEYYEED